MSKKGFGKFIVFAAVAGAAAAGISYFAKYKSFHKELEDDFHDFEDEDFENAPLDSTMNRNYVSIPKETTDLGDMAESLKTAANTAAEKIAEAGSHTAKTVAAKAEDAAQKTEATIGELADQADALTKDISNQAKIAAEKAKEAIHTTADTVKAAAGNITIIEEDMLES